MAKQNKETYPIEAECSHLKLEEVGDEEHPRHRLSIRKTTASPWIVVEAACCLSARYKLFEHVLSGLGEESLWALYCRKNPAEIMRGKRAQEYNGHPSYDHWNVTLWLFNEEPTYRDVQRHCRRASTIQEAAQNVYDEMQHYGVTKTGDGVDYTPELIEYAIEDEWEAQNPEEEDEDEES